MIDEENIDYGEYDVTPLAEDGTTSRKKVLHLRSKETDTDGSPKLPTAEQLEYGELVINYADGAEVLSIKNSNDAIVVFISKRGFIEAPVVESEDYILGVRDNEIVRVANS